MKRRILAVLFSFFALFTFTACVNGTEEHKHEYGEWTVETPATCTQAGEKRQYCSCGYYKTDEIPPLGHSYENYVCTVCGQPDPEAPVTESLEYSEITENGETAAYCVTGAAEDETDILIPSMHKGKPVISIGKNAFYNCENLKSVSAGDGVTLIGELAFADCYALERVTLGKNVKTIDEYAFSQCTMLKQINFPSGLETIGECAFVSCESLESVQLNDGLKSIGDCAFGGCTSLSSFIMPDSVTSIGWGVIMFEVGGAGFVTGEILYNKLTQIVMSDSLTEVSQFAFSHSNIKGIEIGKSVETIDYSSFYGCELLESVVVPKSVKKIVSYSFYRCDSLKEVYYEGSAEEWAEIKIGKNGNDITKEEVTRYFYSETQPEDEGSYWHYVNGEITIW